MLKVDRHRYPRLLWEDVDIIHPCLDIAFIEGDALRPSNCDNLFHDAPQQAPHVGVLSHDTDRLPFSLDGDAANRSIDRVMACLGLLNDAAPMFRSGTRVPGAGVLLALPALLESGVLTVAKEIYGSVGPAFYGLRTTLLALLLMALLRIKRPEGLKECSPVELGRLLGLP